MRLRATRSNSTENSLLEAGSSGTAKRLMAAAKTAAMMRLLSAMAMAAIMGGGVGAVGVRIAATAAGMVLLGGCAREAGRSRPADGAVAGDGDIDAHVGDGQTADGSHVSAECGNGEVESGEQCDDGNTENGDGCSDQCRVEGCDATTCPQGCCNAAGECVWGTQDEACGSGGVACVNCTTEGRLCQGQACFDLGVCSADETLVCGNCGVRHCGADGQWGACEEQGPCGLGDTRTEGDCSRCGVLVSECTTECTWGAPSCTNQGVCEEGEEDEGESCGECGVLVRTCQADCTWGPETCVEDPSNVFYLDNDSDGYGDPNNSTESCTQPAGYVTDNTDCSDNNAAVHPGAADVCANCVDENCDGSDQPCDSSAAITFDPASPSPNASVDVVVSSDHGHACVWLQISGPGVNEHLGNPAVGGGGPYTWTWEDVSLGSAGGYVFKFTANNHSPCNVTHDDVVCRRLDVN